MSIKKISFIFVAVVVAVVGFSIKSSKDIKNEKVVTSATSHVKHWIQKSVRNIKTMAKMDAFEDVTSMSHDAVMAEIKSIDEEIFTPEKINQLNNGLASESEKEEIAALLARRSKLVEVYFKEEVEKITADANLVLQDAQRKLQDYHMEQGAEHEL